MRNEFFTTRDMASDFDGYKRAIIKLTTSLGLVLEEDDENDRIIINGKVVRQGMHDLGGNYMPHWYKIEHSNVPERIVCIAASERSVGKKKIRKAKRAFDAEFPPKLDVWFFNFDKGVRPEWWISEI